MLRAFIIIALAGVVLLGAGYVYGRVKTADVFHEVHARQAESKQKTDRDPGGFLMWMGGGLALIGGAGVGHVLFAKPDDEQKPGEQDR